MTLLQVLKFFVENSTLSAKTLLPIIRELRPAEPDNNDSPYNFISILLIRDYVEYHCNFLNHDTFFKDIEHEVISLKDFNKHPFVIASSED